MTTRSYPRWVGLMAPSLPPPSFPSNQDNFETFITKPKLQKSYKVESSPPPSGIGSYFYPVYTSTLLTSAGLHLPVANSHSISHVKASKVQGHNTTRSYGSLLCSSWSITLVKRPHQTCGVFWKHCGKPSFIA